MDQLGLQFDVLLTRDAGFDGLVIVEGPPRLIQGSTRVSAAYVPGRGKSYVVAKDDIGVFLRQLFVQGASFAFDGG